MATAEVNLIGGKGHSNNQADVVVTNIGAKGNAFSGTFTGRSSFYGVDFITGIYTEKNGWLHVVVIASDTGKPLSAERVDNQSWTLKTAGGTLLGTLSYNSETGDFVIKSPASNWFQGELMGTYMSII